MEIMWTEVRLKKRTVNYNRNAEETTTYFIANVPNEATEGELRKIFEKFGKLSNVYMGQILGENGKYYTFIRFRGTLRGCLA